MIEEMLGPSDLPGDDRTREPVPLPLHLPEEEPRRRIRERDDQDDGSDLPGRTVIVIDVS